MFRRLLAVAAATTLAATPAASATPSPGGPEWNLINTVEATGTTFYGKCPEHVQWTGAYISSERAMAVCTNGQDPSDWTEEQKNTLRHEAVHLIQDCMGRIGDDRLETTTTITRLMRIALSTDLDLQQIERVYRSHGADDLTILLEWEAFSLAETMTTEEVEGLVIKACRL